MWLDKNICFYGKSIIKQRGVKWFALFFGHKDTPLSVYPQIIGMIEKLITSKTASRFIVGNHGEFDYMVLKALRELKQKYPHIRYSVILAYFPSGRQKHDYYSSDETMLPDGIEAVPKKFAISWRNKWMINQSQLVVCYIKHSWGGAAQFVEYAKRQGKEIINLANHTAIQI